MFLPHNRLCKLGLDSDYYSDVASSRDNNIFGIDSRMCWVQIMWRLLWIRLRHPGSDSV